MEMTPLDIQQKQFKTRFRGFDVGEVDLFLEQVAAAFEGLQRERGEMEERIRRLNAENQGHQKREETLKQAMINSQNVIEQMKENARQSADLIVAEAEVKAEKILNRAHNRLAQLHADIAELRRQRIQIEVQIESVLQGHTRLLDAGREGRSAVDREEAKIKLLTPSE